jgi:hypothetical protein
MSATCSTAAPADRLRRIMAAGCAALVLALTVFAASPAAHTWLHCHNDDHAEHPSGTETCVVALFANGVVLELGRLGLIAPVEIVRAIAPTTAAEIFLVSPRYLRQPERGPPLSRVD